tara:strand:- start:593 stop:994 length:402 start_codon:yes stop_codon:yes gene_type:complete
MRKDSRLSRILHTLIHLSGFDYPVTSERIGQMLNTNPVVVRRMMGALKRAGFVTSVKGHNGGWRLAAGLDTITLYDIHRLTGDGSVFTIGLTDEHNNCPIERAVNTQISDVLSEAETLMLQRFKAITLAQLAP